MNDEVTNQILLGWWLDMKVLRFPGERPLPHKSIAYKTRSFTYKESDYSNEWDLSIISVERGKWRHDSLTASEIINR